MPFNVALRICKTYCNLSVQLSEHWGEHPFKHTLTQSLIQAHKQGFEQGLKHSVLSLTCLLCVACASPPSALNPTHLPPNLPPDLPPVAANGRAFPTAMPNAAPVVTAPVGASPAPMPAASSPHTGAPKTPPPNPLWQAVGLNDLPNWRSDSPLAAWSGLQRSCTRLAQQPRWQAFCAAANSTPADEASARHVLERHLTAYTQTDEAGHATGIATAYFEPVYAGRLVRGGAFQWPLYAAPDPMTTLPRELLTPISGRAHPVLAGKALAWLDNPIDPFLAQVQGSLRVRLEDGTVKRLGFAGKNGLPYVSIANTLIRQGVFTSNQASMERIQAWATSKDAPTVQAVLNSNPSFVFFRWLDIATELGPVGAYAVPLTPMRSVAVDPAYTPLGVPVWLETTTANGALAQLMLAQDVGSAIKGAARVDIFTGTGDAAGRLASAQKYPSKVWVLWPK